MIVTLLNSYSSETEANIAAAICIGKHNKALEHNNFNYVSAAIDSNHLSVIEHLPLTFLIEDISRACSHQLVRHRHFNFSQLSQRYTKIDTNTDWYITPPSVNRDTDPLHKYELAMLETGLIYNQLMEQGISEEDARMILPNACKTSLVVSCNARAFAEACNKRTCEKAQWEIKELFTMMRERIKDIYPNVYPLCFPNCEANNSRGCLETYPCDKYDD